jgi:LPS-assembly protein
VHCCSSHEVGPGFKTRLSTRGRKTLAFWLVIVIHFCLSRGVVQGQDKQKEAASPPEEPVPPEFQWSGPTRSIQAEQQRRIGKHDFRATGKVEIRDLDMLLKADEVWGNDETQDVEGEGNVYFEQGQQKIWGERFKLNLRTKLGTFYQVKGRADPGFVFEAAEVEKLADDRYRIVKGFVTSCEDKVPKWSFRMSEAFFRVDQNVNLKNMIFRIKKIPLLYSPYLYAPTNERQRQTGFLIPSIGNSNTRGRSVSEAFFLTLGRSADVLATMEYYSLRGVAGGLDFRARPSERSRILAQSFFAQDRLGQGGQSLQMVADTQFQNGFRGVADIYAVSSQEFQQVYGDTFYNVVRPDEISSGFLTRSFSSYSMNVFGERRVTKFPDQVVKSRTFPSFNLSGHSRQLKDWPIYLSFGASAEGLSRSDSQLSTPPIVQRFDLNPRITVPLKKFRAFSFTPSFGLHETFYSDQMSLVADTGISPRNLVRSAFDVQGHFIGPSFEKVFEADGNRYKHVIEPEIIYRYVNGVSEFDRIIRFDEHDILSDSNEVEYGLSNRFFSRRRASDGGYTTNEFLSIRIAQKYFFDPTFGGALIPGRRNVFYPLNTLTAFAFEDSYRRFSPIIARVRFTPASRYQADFRIDYDQQAHKVRAASVSGAAYISVGFVALTYYNTNNLPPTQFPSNQIRATLGYGSSLRRGMNAAFNFSYDFDAKVLQYSATQLAYNWDCCGVALEVRQYNFGVRDETQFRFSFSLKNIGAFGNLRQQERLF